MRRTMSVSGGQDLDARVRAMARDAQQRHHGSLDTASQDFVDDFPGPFQRDVGHLQLRRLQEVGHAHMCGAAVACRGVVVGVGLGPDVRDKRSQVGGFEAAGGDQREV